MKPVVAAGLGFMGGVLTLFFSRKAGASSRVLPGVGLVSWEKFVGVMASAPKEYVSPRYRLGTFQMDARRLKDVGAMKTAMKGIYGDEAGIWMGKWQEGLTEKKFLGSMPLQYAAFCRSMRAAAPKVSGHVGRIVDGRKCSLSGLLGVCHVAGEGGFVGWVDGAKRFPATTEVFVRTNGIF